MLRLFAGNTVIEQLFFGAEGQTWLEYNPDGFATDLAPTTEDGESVPVRSAFFDGQVIVRAGHPWTFHPMGTARLTPEGAPPTTDGGERHGWDQLWLLGDPVPARVGCGPEPLADAAMLAESIRSVPDLEVTAPVAVSVEGAEGLMLDVGSATRGTFCATFNDGRRSPLISEDAFGARMRLYLFDLPEGSSMRTLAIAIIAPEATFQRAVTAAWPIVASLEFPVQGPSATGSAVPGA
jgi:hypothetical protein